MSMPGRTPLGSSITIERTKRQGSLPLQRVLEPADSVLDLACNLVGLAVSLQLGIAGRLADCLLDRALDLFRCSRDPILIHDFILLLWAQVPCIEATVSGWITPPVASETTQIRPPSRAGLVIRHRGGFRGWLVPRLVSGSFRGYRRRLGSRYGRMLLVGSLAVAGESKYFTSLA